jgi:hypothetical protein
MLAIGDGVDIPMLDAPAFVTSPTRDNFTCFAPVFGLGRDLTDDLIQTLVDAAREQWGLVWMGMEP